MYAFLRVKEKDGKTPHVCFPVSETSALTVANLLGAINRGQERRIVTAGLRIVPAAGAVPFDGLAEFLKWFGELYFPNSPVVLAEQPK